MANGQRMKTNKEPASKAVTSADSTSSPNLESMPLGASKSLSTSTTTATTQKGSQKIWQSVELQGLKSKVGIVAGALADFQTAGGLVVRKKVDYTLPSGRKFSALKLYLIVESVDLVAVETPDGIDFDLVVEGGVKSQKETDTK